MSSSAPIFVLAAICGFAVGCVPIQKKSIVHYGVQGRLTNAASGAPLERSHISIVVDGREFDRKTNHRGEFKVAPEMHHFWTWLGGPMWMDATRATVEISLQGCTPYHRTFMLRSEGIEVPVALDQDRLEGGYVLLGDIEIKKREPDGTANGSQPFCSETNSALSSAGSRR